MTVHDHTSAQAGNRRGRAFGMNVESQFPLPGVLGHAAADEAPTTLGLASMKALDAGWPAEEAVRVDELRRRDGRLAMAIDHHPKLGYRLDAPGFGRYRVTRDGLCIRCAPVQLATWRRARFITARALPVAATLRGLEILHASAVALGDRAVAITGPSHSGKTSLALRLVLEGARFITDDVLALEPRGDEVIAHPGAGLAGVRYAEHGLLTSDDRGRLGRLNDRGDKVWASLPSEERALPLSLVYFLRRESGGEAAAIERIEPPDPRLLLGSTFLNGVIRTPERLRRQLDACARLSRAAAGYLVTFPPAVGATALARLVATHARAALGEGRAPDVRSTLGPGSLPQTPVSASTAEARVT